MLGIPVHARNVLISAFRDRVCEKMGETPFVHQRKWWMMSDGLELSDRIIDPEGIAVRLGDGTIEKWAYTPRAQGRARFIADLGAFKVGKSWGAARWATGFGAVPGARVNLVGLEYDICAPEFDYIVEALLSERGMGLKYESLQNRPRDGKMWLDLQNGARFEARSWERKDSLKGKEIDAYLYCEAYQLPGIECFTDFSQNLRVRQGFAVFATTPDRPWVKELHQLGHGHDAEWACVCNIAADVNPYSYDAKAKQRDQTLMTREKFAIHYLGQLGDFVGRVFQYERGQVQFSSANHPELFPAGGDRREDFRVPPGWEVVSGADTGTYYTGLAVAFSPEGDAYVFDEWPNYRYIAGRPERDESVTIPGWANTVAHDLVQRGGRPVMWADRNSQFKRELQAYGITLLPANAPVEARTEITREYFQHGKVHLAPWLEVLPFELENAAWPEEASASGKFGRVKDRDHTLDCLEHVLARRPRGRWASTMKAEGRWIDTFVRGSRPKWRSGAHNVHLGDN